MWQRAEVEEMLYAGAIPSSIRCLLFMDREGRFPCGSARPPTHAKAIGTDDQAAILILEINQNRPAVGA